MLDRKPFLAEIYEELFRAMLGDSKPRLLDIGCGTGFYWNILRKYCSSVTGIDSSDAMVHEARRFVFDRGVVNIQVETGDVGKMKFQSDSFDAVLSMDLLHHAANVEACLSESYRVLKAGGKLYVVEPNCLNPLMFLMHAVPKEERRGIYRNNKFYLLNKMKKYFSNIQHNYINFIISLETLKEADILKDVDRWLTSRRVRWLSFRQLLIAEKRLYE